MSDHNQLRDSLPPWLTDEAKRAESETIGAMIKDAETRDKIIEIVGKDDFAFHVYGVIFGAIMDLVNGQKSVSPDTVAIQLKQTGDIDHLGHNPYIFISNLTDWAGSAFNGVDYAREVAKNSQRHRLVAAFTIALRDATDLGCDPHELLEGTAQRLYDLASADSTRRTGEAVPLARVVNTLINELDKPRQSSAPDFIQTGLERIDNVIGGFRPGELWIVAARPGVGKSALALLMAMNASRRGHPTMIFSLEMSKEELARRSIAINSGVPLNEIMRPPLPTDSMAIIRGGVGVGPVYADDRGDINSSKIASATRRATQMKGVRMIVVDYLQLITPENSRDRRDLQVGLDTRRLKQLARQCGIPVICLSQLNREGDQFAQPKLTQLRESGSIEQDADGVIFLWQDATSNGQVEQRIKCEVAKQRNGPTSDFELNYRRTCVRFENGGSSW